MTLDKRAKYLFCANVMVHTLMVLAHHCCTCMHALSSTSLSTWRVSCALVKMKCLNVTKMRYIHIVAIIHEGRHS